MYLRKNSFMGQALQTEDKLKKSVKKTLNAFFSKHIFFKTACKITFRLFNRLTWNFNTIFFYTFSRELLGFFQKIEKFFAIDIYLR